MRRNDQLGAILTLGALVMFLVVVAGIESLAQLKVHLQLGDIATWFSGIATVIVAVFAVLISRRAHRTAQLALGNQVRDEALNVSWWLEPVDHGANKERAGVRDWPRPLGTASHEVTYPTEDDGARVAVLVVVNDNRTVISDATFAMSDDLDRVHEISAGEKPLGLIRPGEVYYRVYFMMAGDTPAAWDSDNQDVERHGFAFWLQFTDSEGHRWRRHGNGRLEPLNDDVRELLDWS